MSNHADSTPAPINTPAAPETDVDATATPVDTVPFIASALAPTSLGAKDSKKDHIVQELDSLFLVTSILLSTIYLHDNLTSLLLLRASSQHVHIASLPFTVATQTSGSLPAVLVANAICILTHLIRAAPVADGNWSRGYLHGGLLMDFVGELGPTSKSKLLVMDLMVLGLQALMLMIMTEQRTEVGDRRSNPAQDLRAEEEGRRRSQSSDREDHPMLGEDGAEDGIAMENLGDTRSRERQKGSSRRNEDVVMTINVKQGLKELLQRPDPDRTDVNTAGVERVNTIISRLLARSRGSDTA